MQTVKVKKVELLTKIKENRVAHEKEYTEAIAGFKDAQMLKLTDMINRVIANERLSSQSTGLREPVSNIKEYDRIIAMLEMSVDEEIELTMQDFNNYVLDEWTWAIQGKLTNSAYLSHH